MGKVKNKIKKYNIQAFLSRLNWVYGYGRKHILAIIIYTIVGMSGALVGILGSLVSRDLVDIVTNHQTGNLLKTFVMMIVIQLVTIVINNASSYISAKVNLHVEKTIKADIYEKIIKTDWQELSKFHSGDIVSRWSGDSANVSMGILNIFPNAVIYTFRFASALYLVVTQDATFAVFALASVPLSLLVSRTNMKRMRKTNMESVQFNAKMASFTQESFSNVQNIKALDMIGLYCRKLKELQNENESRKLRFQRISILNSIILTLVSSLISYSTYGWGVYRVWSGAISYGSMTMFISLSHSLSGTVQNFLNLIPTTVSLSNSAQRIMDILELKKEDYSDDDKVIDFLESNRSKGIEICIDDVSFSYLNGNKVFEHASFVARPREVVGLVGPSGEGKTTMLRLLLALVSQEEGVTSLRVSGDESQTIDISASVRKMIAYVPQGNTMFPGTIAENMRNVKEDATDEEIVEALKRACAWDFVSKLPDGINAEVKERGGGFSEGQAQRLSIARALLRRSPILLLDEATSALDMDTSKRVLDNIATDDYPRTCIVTTHRMEVMDICNRVYKVADNTITEVSSGIER